MKLRLCILVLLLALSAAPAFGQGCIMCYEGAKGASTGGQNALSRAVLVLLVPPVGMMSLLVGFAFRYSKKREEAEETSSQDSVLRTQ